MNSPVGPIGKNVLEKIPRVFTAESLWRGISHSYAHSVNPREIVEAFAFFGKPTDDDMRWMTPHLLIDLFLRGFCTNEALTRWLQRCRVHARGGILSDLCANVTSWHVRRESLMRRVVAYFKNLTYWEYLMCVNYEPGKEEKLKHILESLRPEIESKNSEFFLMSYPFWCFYFSGAYLHLIEKEYRPSVCARAEWVVRLPSINFWRGYVYSDSKLNQFRLDYVAIKAYFRYIRETTSKPAPCKLADVPYIVESYQMDVKAPNNNTTTNVSKPEDAEWDPLRVAMALYRNSNLYNPGDLRVAKQAFHTLYKTLEREDELTDPIELILPVNDTIEGRFYIFRAMNYDLLKSLTNIDQFTELFIGFCDDVLRVARPADFADEVLRAEHYSACEAEVNQRDCYVSKMRFHLYFSLILDGIVPYPEGTEAHLIAELNPPWIRSTMAMSQTAVPAICDTPEGLVHWCRRLRSRNPAPSWLAQYAYSIGVQKTPEDTSAMMRFRPKSLRYGMPSFSAFIWHKSRDTITSLLLSLTIGLGGSVEDGKIMSMVPLEVRIMLVSIFFYYFQWQNGELRWRLYEFM